MLQHQVDTQINARAVKTVRTEGALLSDPEGIFHVLMAQYEDAAALLEEVAEQSEEDIDLCKKLLGKLKKDLISLGSAANKAFYGPLKKKEPTRELVLKGEEEHKLIKRLLLELDQMSLENEHWPAKLAVLRYLVEHHIDDTKEIMFIEAQKVLANTQSRDIARRFETERSKELAKI